MRGESIYLIRVTHGRDNYNGGTSTWLARGTSVDKAERAVDNFLAGFGVAAPTGYDTQVAAPSVRGLDVEQVA